jgi:hypothetical protein
MSDTALKQKVRDMLAAGSTLPEVVLEVSWQRIDDDWSMAKRVAFVKRTRWDMSRGV